VEQVASVGQVTELTEGLMAAVISQLPTILSMFS